MEQKNSLPVSTLFNFLDVTLGCIMCTSDYAEVLKLGLSEGEELVMVGEEIELEGHTCRVIDIRLHLGKEVKEPTNSHPYSHQRVGRKFPYQLEVEIFTERLNYMDLGED